jgi:hypothetical protein
MTITISPTAGQLYALIKKRTHVHTGRKNAVPTPPPANIAAIKRKWGVMRIVTKLGKPQNT